MTTPIRRKLVKGATAAALTLPLFAGGTALASSMGEPDTATLDLDLDQKLLEVNTWYGSGYTFEELLAVAEEWHLGQLEAKARATPAILAGDTAEIDAIIAAAGRLPTASAPSEPVTSDGDAVMAAVSDPTAAAAFWDAGYSYDELQVLAGDWQLDEFEAKVRAGQMVLDGRRDELDHQLTPS